MGKLFDKYDDFVRYLARKSPSINAIVFACIFSVIIFGSPVLGTILLVTVLILALIRMKRSRQEEEN